MSPWRQPLRSIDRSLSTSDAGVVHMPRTGPTTGLRETLQEATGLPWLLPTVEPIGQGAYLGTRSALDTADHGVLIRTA